MVMLDISKPKVHLIKQLYYATVVSLSTLNFVSCLTINTSPLEFNARTGIYCLWL